MTLLCGDCQADVVKTGCDITKRVFLFGFQVDVVEGDKLPTDLHRTTIMDLHHLVYLCVHRNNVVPIW